MELRTQSAPESRRVGLDLGPIALAGMVLAAAAGIIVAVAIAGNGSGRASDAAGTAKDVALTGPVVIDESYTIPTRGDRLQVFIVGSAEHAEALHEQLAEFAGLVEAHGATPMLFDVVLIDSPEREEAIVAGLADLSAIRQIVLTGAATIITDLR